MDFPVFLLKKCSGQSVPSAAVYSSEIFVPEGHVFHLKALPLQVVQLPRVRGEVEAQLIGVQRLPRLPIPPVHVAPPVLAVPQQRTAQIGHGRPDLWVRPVSSPISTRLSSPRVSSTR